MEKKLPWVPTLVAQVCLCFGLYLVFQLGQPQMSVNRHGSETSALDLYFISVRGGFRPPNQQTRLLKLMAKVAKKYKQKFVVDISDLGKNDPLMQNGTLRFSSLKVPWYTTTVSQTGRGYFQKKINLPYKKTLDVIGVDTGLLQVVTPGSLPGLGNSQLPWLRRTLEATNSNWRIVVGFHPLSVCEDGEERIEAKEACESLRHTFMKFEVNAYLSGQGCNRSARLGSLSYIRNPSRMEADAYVASANETSGFGREFEDGFLLHRVSSLKLVTYFVSLGGEVVRISVLHHKRKDIM